jgi:hypothetical protein
LYLLYSYSALAFTRAIFSLGTTRPTWLSPKQRDTKYGMMLQILTSVTLLLTFTSKSVASKKQIGKFIADVSNRLLCTVILGLLKIGYDNLRRNIAKIFDIINGLVHGERKDVSEEEARNALSYTEDLLALLKTYD